MLRQIESRLFILSTDSKPYERVEDLHNDPRPDKRKHPGDQDGDKLFAELARIPVEEAVGAGVVDRLRSEEPCGKSAPCAADAMDSHHIQRIVVAELSFHIAGVVAEEARDSPDDDGRHRPHKP